MPPPAGGADLSSLPSSRTQFMTATWLMRAPVSRSNSSAVLRYDSSAACLTTHRKAHADSLERFGMPKSSSAHVRRLPQRSR